MPFRNEVPPQMRNRIQDVAQQIRDEELGPPFTEETIQGVAGEREISTKYARQLTDIASAWIFRKQVDALIEEAQSGNLEGIEPIGTLSGSDEEHS